MSASDKRRSILTAAVSVFAKHGFYNSKVADIAREAGVADGTIYLYFKNKEDILSQVFLDTMESVLDRQISALEGLTDPVAMLHSIVREHFNQVEENPALAEVMTVELRQSSKFMRSTDLKPFGRYLGIMAKAIESGQEQGLFNRKMDPRRSARALFGVLDELALEWAISESDTPVNDACDVVATLFLDGLRVREKRSVVSS